MCGVATRERYGAAVIACARLFLEFFPERTVVTVMGLPLPAHGRGHRIHPDTPSSHPAAVSHAASSADLAGWPLSPMMPPCTPAAAASATGMHLEIMHRIGPAVPATTASRLPGPWPTKTGFDRACSDPVNRTSRLGPTIIALTAGPPPERRLRCPSGRQARSARRWLPGPLNRKPIADVLGPALVRPAHPQQDRRALAASSDLHRVANPASQRQSHPSTPRTNSSRPAAGSPAAIIARLSFGHVPPGKPAPAATPSATRAGRRGVTRRTSGR
jgi:hypothetical protein